MQGNVVVGNYVGTNAAGTAVIDSLRTGIVIQDAFDNGIGGSDPGEGNLISGNNTGVRITNSLSSGNLVRGNLIGTAADGTGPLGNQTGIDVFFTSETNTIGGTSPAAANTIAFNLRDGVLVYPGAIGASILGNSIHSNAEQGIDLVATGFAPSGDGVTANDSDDPDTGGNSLQNHPVLSSAEIGASTTVAGSLNSSADTTYRLEFFEVPACDTVGGNGEGETYLGFTEVTTNAGGDVSSTSRLRRRLRWAPLPRPPPPRRQHLRAIGLRRGDGRGNRGAQRRPRSEGYVEAHVAARRWW